MTSRSRRAGRSSVAARLGDERDHQRAEAEREEGGVDRMAEFPAIAEAGPVVRQGRRRPTAQRAFTGATMANQTARPAVTQRLAATVHAKAKERRRTCIATTQVSRIENDDRPDDAERNVQILLDDEPGCAVQPQFARYLHDMAEDHAEGQRHQQQTEKPGRPEKDR
jgi:hypothetical protein